MPETMAGLSALTSSISAFSNEMNAALTASALFEPATDWRISYLGIDGSAVSAVAVIFI